MKFIDRDRKSMFFVNMDNTVIFCCRWRGVGTVEEVKNTLIWPLAYI